MWSLGMIAGIAVGLEHVHDMAFGDRWNDASLGLDSSKISKRLEGLDVREKP